MKTKVPSQIKGPKDQILNRVLLVLTTIVFFALAASFSRIYSVGWKPVFAFQAGLFLCVFVLYLMRGRVSVKTKSYFLLALFYLAAMSSIVAFGYMSDAKMVLVVLPVFAILFLGNKPSLYILAFSMLSYAFLAYLHLSGKLVYDFDIESYINSPKPWLISGIVLLMVMGILMTTTKILFDTQNKVVMQLGESEERYRTLFENANDAIIVQDTNLVFIECNSKAEEMLKLPRWQIIGKTPEMLSPKNQPNQKDSKTLAAELKDLVMAGKPQVFDWEVVGGENTSLHLEVSLSMFMFSGEKHFLSVVRDVTERRTQKLALERSEEHYRALVENMPIVCFTYNENGDVLSWNKAAEKVYGYSKAEAIGKSSYDLIVTPLTLDRTKEVIKEVFGGKPVIGAEWQDKDKQGQLGWRFGNTFPLFNPDGSIECGVNMNIDITSRKIADDELKNEKEFSDLSINALSDTFFVFDPETGEAIRWNKAFEDVSGYTAQEIKKMKAPDSYYSQEDLAKAAETTNKITSGMAGKMEMSLICKNGRQVPYEYSASLIKDEKGNPKYIISIGRDITERKKTERAIVESEENYRSLFENSRDGIVTVTRDGKIVDCNKAYTLMLGYPKEELIDKSFYQITPAKWHEWERQEIVGNQLLQKGYSGIYEKEYIRKDGTVFPVELHAFKYEMQSGKTLMWAIVRDISERKKAQEALLESEGKYRIMAETSPDAVTTSDLEGKITFASKRTAEIHGYDNPGECVGKNAFELIAPEDREIALLNLKKTLEQGFIRDIGYKCLKKNGDWFYAELSGSLLKNAKNEPIGFLAITKDVTYKIKAAKELEERLLFEKTLSEFSSRFVNLPAEKVNSEITNSFEFIGKNLDIDRIFLWELTDDKTEYLVNCAWAVEGIQNLPLTLKSNFFPYIKKTLLNKEVFKFSTLDEIPAEAAIEMNYYQQNGIKSGSVIPLIMAGEVIGCISFSKVKIEKEWTENAIRFFSMLGHILSNALQRRNTEMLLRESEEKFQKVFMVNPYSITISKISTGEIVDVNEGFEKEFGFSREEVVGKKSLDIGMWKHPENRDEMMAQFKKNGLVHDREIELVKRSGESIVLLTSLKIIEFKGEPHIINIIKNITEQKKAEQALKESEERFRLLIENIPAVTWVTSQEGRTTYISPNIKNVYGYSQDEILAEGAKLWFDRIHPDDLEKVREEYGKLFEKDHDFDIEYRIKRKDGQWIWLHDRANIFKQKEGVNYAYGVFYDITREKTAEIALKISEEKFKLIFNSVADAVFIMDMQGNYLEVNDVAVKRYGYTRKQFLTMTPVDILPKDMKYKLPLVLNEIKRKSYAVVEIEHIVSRGKQIPVELNARKIIFDDKDAIIVVVRDITERKQKQKEIFEAVIEAEENERSRIAKDLHDGVSPILSAIKIYVQTLDDNLGQETRIIANQKINNSINEAITGIKEISANLSPHILHNFGMVTAVQSFIGKLQNMKSLSIDFEYNTEERFDEKIETTLYRVVIELINNTIKHASASKIFIKFTLGMETALEYRDNGKGFDVGKMLEAKKGMGLFNIINRVEFLKGTVLINSQKDKGMSVNLKIPLND